MHFGWIPDLPDHRDFLRAPHAAGTALPTSVDLRAGCPAVYDQGDLGSCTANAIGAALQYDQISQQEIDFVPSRLFIYYNERFDEGTVASDSGAQIRTGIKSVNALGACAELVWPYDISKFTELPPPSAYYDAKKRQALRYERVPQTEQDMKTCLASGVPIVLGFTVYESFETSATAQTGVVVMPGPQERVLGGHAVLAVGYFDSTARFLLRNSWGDGWGIGGYFTMPYQYLTNPNLCDDLWAIQVVA